MERFVKYTFLLWLMLAALYMSGCDEDEPGLPNPLRFTVSSATFEGAAFNAPTGYSVSVTYTDAGVPTSFTATNSSQFTPTPGNSGTLSVSGNQVTFTVGNDVRTCTITAGNFSQTSASVSLSFTLNKNDHEIAFEQEGTYVYVMTVAN